ncbi:MAG: hypothetical protein PHN69_05610 [Candidatus Pacebacteria bacterium]|nr:hypothetical protein [Candidatus Paceibacterota bacterium]
MEANNSIFVGAFNGGGNDSFFNACIVNNSIFTDTTLPEGFWIANSVVTGAVTADLFMDYTNRDYRLKYDSRAVNFGSNALWNANSNNITTDILGLLRQVDVSIDAGCYEFQGVTVITPSSMSLYDLDSLNTSYANDQKVGVQIDADSRAAYWLLTEEPATPSVTNNLWQASRPGDYIFKNNKNELKTIYLWTKNWYNQVVNSVVVATINYDDVYPELSAIAIADTSSASVTAIEEAYYLKVGTYNVTFNFNEEMIITSTIWLENGSVTEVVTELSRNALEVTRVTDRTYTVEYVITSGTTEGSYSINYSATDNAGNKVVAHYYEPPLGGLGALVVDVSPPTVNLEILDTDTLSNLYTNSRNVVLSINVEEANTYGYYVTENFEFTLSEVEGLFTVHQPTTYNFFTLFAESKSLKLLVIDKAGNISSASYAITLDTQVPTATIELPVSASWLNIGEHRITLNVGGVVSGLVATPSLMFVANGTLPLNLPLERETDNQYSVTLSITTFTGDGVGYFLFSATDNASNIVNGIKPPLGGLGAGASSVYVSTDMKLPTFRIFDMDTGSEAFTDDQTIGITISNDEQAKAWMIVENNSANPAANSELWVLSKPYTYTVRNAMDGYKKLYLWYRNANGVVSSGSVIPSAEIKLDTTIPYFVSWEITKDIIITSDFSDGGEALGFLRVGTYNVTFNFSEEVILTPEISIISGDSLIYSFNGSLLRENDATFTSELIVTTGMVNGKFELSCGITDNALLTGNVISSPYKYFWIDTTVNVPSSFILYDIDNFNQIECNDNVVGMQYTANPDHYRWIWGESATKFATPNVDSNLWQDYFPAQYPFQDLAEGMKTVYLWAKDRAGNISDRSAVSISYLRIDYLQDAYVSVHLENEYLLAGEHSLTLAIHEIGIVTPTLWLEVSTIDSRLQLDLFNVTTSNGFTFYQATFNVPDDGSYDGVGHFEVKVTNNNGVIYNFVGLAYINIEGDSKVYFDTKVNSPNGFLLMDKDSNSDEYTDDFVVNVRIIEDKDHFEWIIGEEYSTQPSADNQRWTRTRPSQYMFKNNVIEVKRVYLWAKDRAGNISQRATAEIDYNPSNQSLSAYVSVDLPNILVKESILAITIDVRDIAIDTPNVWLYINKTNQRITLNIYSATTIDSAGTYYLATFNVLGNEVYDGIAYFEVVVTNSGRAVIDLTGENYKYIGRDKEFLIDTSINVPELILYDFESKRTDYTNDLVPNVSITNDGDITGWILSELASVRPSIDSTMWQPVAPSQYQFKNVNEGLKKVYLWVKDGAGNVNQSVVFHQIRYDISDPLVSLIGLWDSNISSVIYFVTLNISEPIDITPSLTYDLNNGVIVGQAKPYLFDVNSRDIWLATIDISSAGDSVWKADFNIIVTDNAWNVQTNFLRVQGTGLSQETTLNFVSIKTGLEYYKEGEYKITIDFNTQVPFAITPDVYLHHVGYSGAEQFTKLTLDAFEMISSFGVRYPVSFNVMPNGAQDGLVYFHIKVTRDSGTVVSITSDELAETWIVGRHKVTFDTGVFVLSLDVFDKSSGYYDYLNDQVLGVSINAEEGIINWLMSETQAATPSIGDRNWSQTEPFEYRLNYLAEEVKTIYLWAQDIAGNFALATANIKYDVSKPILNQLEVQRVLASADSVWPVDDVFYLRAGTYNITFNFNEELLSTPDIWVQKKSAVEKSHLLLSKENDSVYVGELFVTSGIEEGNYEIHYNAADKAVNKSVDQKFVTVSFMIDKTSPSLSLVIRDFDSGSHLFTNSTTVLLQINNDEPVVYIVTEDMLYIARTTHNWDITINTYQITQNNGFVELGLWGKDLAGNMSFVTASILLDTLIPSVVVDMPVNPFAVPEGSIEITFNINNVISGLASTPDFYFVPYNRSPVFITINSTTISNIFQGILAVTTYTGDGPGYFIFNATDNAGNAIHINNVRNDEYFRIKWSGGEITTNVLVVSTNVLLPVLVAFDIDQLNQDYTNDQVVGLRISKDYQAIAWLIKEDDAQPLSSDALWRSVRPVEHVFWNNKNEVKTIYLWTKDQASKVSSQPVLTRITYDTINPWVESIEVGNNGHMGAGTFDVTINLSEVLDVVNAPTPEIWIKVNGVARNLDYEVSGSYSVITSSIVVTSGMAGSGMFYLKISDNANNGGTIISSGAMMVFDFVSPNIDYLLVQDRDSFSPIFTNEKTVRLQYQLTDQPLGEVYRWYVTENTGVVLDRYFSKWLTEAPVFYSMDDVQGSKNVVLWVMDRAFNANSKVGTIIYDSVVSPNLPGITIDISMHPMAIVTGTVYVTLNIDGLESGLVATPSFSILMGSGQTIPITINGLAREGILYKYYGYFDINTNSGDGPAKFIVQGQNGAMDYVNLVSAIRFNTMDFANKLLINTIVKTPTINVYDLDNSAQRRNTSDTSDVWTNDQTIGVLIGNDEQAVAWLLSEDQNSFPSPVSASWVKVRPAAYTFKNYINEEKKLYLWIKNFNNQVSLVPAVITINYDDAPPYVSSIQMTNNSYFVGGEERITINLNESVQNTPDFKAFMDGQDVTFNIIKIDDLTYVVTWSITENMLEGTYQWTVFLKDKAGNVGSAIESGKLFYLDFAISAPSRFDLKDKDTSSPHKTNDLVVDVDISYDPDHVAWIMGEEFSEESIGSLNRLSAGWRYVKPVEYYFNNLQSGEKKVYLWVMDRAGHITTHSMLASIVYIPGEREDVNYVIAQTSGGNRFFPGDYQLTFNVFEVNKNTPNVSFIWPDGSEQIITLSFVSTDNVYGTYYSASISVSRDESLIGDGYFSVGITRNDGTFFGAYSIGDAGEMLGGDSVVHIYVPYISLVTFNKLLDSVVIGESGAKIMSFQLKGNTPFLGIENIRVTVTGQIFSTEILGVYLVKRNNDVIDSRTILTYKEMFDKDTNTALLSFSNKPEVPADSGTIYEIVMDISPFAISSHVFIVEISPGDFLVNDNLMIISDNFPINSGPITIARRKSDMLLGKNSVPSVNVRMGDNNIILYDLSFQAMNGKGSLSGFILNKSLTIPDELFSNLRLYRKLSYGGEYQFAHDELLARGTQKINDSDNKIYIEQSRIHVRFSPFQTIQETQQNFYIVADLSYVTSSVNEFSLYFSSTSSVLVGNDSVMLPVDTSVLSTTFNLTPYIPRVKVAPEFVLEDALFEQTTANHVLDLCLRTDHETTSVSSIIITFDYQGESTNRLTAILAVDGEELSRRALSSGRVVFDLSRVLTLNENIVTVALLLDVGSYSPSTVKVFASNGCVVASPSIHLPVNYSTVTINIKSSLHPRKPKGIFPNYFNTVVSFNLMAKVYSVDSKDNVYVRLINNQDQSLVLDNTLLVERTVTSSLLSVMDSVTRSLVVYNVPLQPAAAYKVGIKLVNDLGLESETYEKIVTADLTKPYFDETELTVRRLDNEVGFSVLWGHVNEDVSAVTHIEIWARIGEDPRWSIVYVVSPNLTLRNIANLVPETSYYFKALAYNSAGLVSEPLMHKGSFQTSLPVGMLTKLSNYPNPFNSNKQDTTITYFLNRDMDVTIKIYNIYGKKVYEKYCFSGENGGREGNNEILWGGIDQSGRKLPMGSYPMVIYDGGAKNILDQRVIGVVH